jgi:hypothetical protein
MDIVRTFIEDCCEVDAAASESATNLTVKK